MAVFAIATGAAPSAAAVTIITTVSQLQKISNNLAGDYRLGSNIDASATKSWNNGAGFIPLGTNSVAPNSPTPFTGAFDGAGHKISNLTIASSPTSVYTALFAYLGSKGVVENVSLTNVSVTSSYQGILNGKYLLGEIAALVAFNSGRVANDSTTGTVSLSGYYNVVAGLVGASDGSIENSSADVAVTGTAINTEFPGFAVGGLVGTNLSIDKSKGMVTGSSESGKVIGIVSTDAGPGYTGGLVALNEGTIEHSHSAGQVGCSGCWVGGLVGYNLKGALIKQSYSSADVGSSLNGRIGGLVGGNDPEATISNAHATGVLVSDGGNSAVGGLLGWNYGTVTLSWASGNVAGIKGSESFADTSNLGGLVGYNDETGLIEKSYATGKVTDNLTPGVAVGGLVGANFGGPKGGRIAECYATGEVTGTGFESFVGGLVGSNSFTHANGSVENSYATGAVTGGQMSPVGAVIGESDDGNAAYVYGIGRVAGGKRAFLGGVLGAVNPGGNINIHDYWDIDTTGRPKGTGRGSQAGLTGLSNATLKSGRLPTGFDRSIWVTKSGSYPFLRALPRG